MPADLTPKAIEELRERLANYSKVKWPSMSLPVEQVTALIAAAEENAELRKLGERMGSGWALVEAEELTAERDAALRERDEALAKSRIDEQQCDDMTAQAAKLAEECKHLRSQRDGLVEAAEALFANSDYTTIRPEHEASFAGTNELMALRDTLRKAREGAK